MEAAFLITTAELILKLIIPTATGKAISIWNNEDEIERLSDTIEYIGAVLSDVHGKKYEDSSVNYGYKRLRRAYLDAQDFLDRVETIRRKREAEARNINQAEEEIINGKGKCSLAFVCIKIKPINMKTVRFFSSSNQAKYALEVNNVIKKIRTNLDAISQDLQKYGLREISSNSEVDPRTGRASGSYSDQVNKPIGRDQDTRRIVNLMLKPHVADHKKIPWISIVGIGGIGKTTVAQLVYADKFLLETCKFDMKLWVSDSKKYNFESLLKHILKSICFTDTSLDTLEEDQLSTRLVDGIRGKTFLLVLDDVEDKSCYIVERLEILLNYGSNESRALITTRSRKVANDIVGSSDSIYLLQGLSEEDSLQLFERYAFRQQKRDERLVQIANLIVRKCWGVSLYIKVVGSYLYGKGIEKWEEVRDESFTRVEDEGNPVMLIWKSYDGLDSIRILG